MHPICDILAEALRTDITQMIEEGHGESALLVEFDMARAAGSVDALLALQEELWRRPSPPDFPYEEPSDWESIAACFPDPESHARFAGSDEDLADRLHAAWLGRCAGCQLGKPLEGTMWPEKIRETLEFVGSWPLSDYMNPIPDGTRAKGLPDTAFFRTPHADHSTRGRFSAVQVDDDIHYTLTSLLVLEKHGAEFTTQQAIETVYYHTPCSCVFAAGRSMLRTGIFGLRPPHTALFGNPCRQSLGGTIRCDAYGWAAPANPALAARMAFTDASGSQTRNGIYSAIFFAVILADILAHGDPARAIDTAEAYVPPRSRFAEMIRFVRSACIAENDWEKVTALILRRYSEEAARFNHSIPNAAIVILGLLKGGMDFTHTLRIAVLSGLDTDCNGATAGSIMGCALGTGGIPSHWTDPFNDTIETCLREMPELRISDAAQRTGEIARKNLRR